jgi:hypothetical protein
MRTPCRWPRKRTRRRRKPCVEISVVPDEDERHDVLIGPPDDKP